MYRYGPATLALAALALLSGCASAPPGVADLPAATPGVELADTPFFPQERFQCGPAALATVLTAAGVETSPEALVPRVYIPGKKGSLREELVAATRASGRLPYVIEGSLSALAAELAAGRPVLVLQNLGIAAIPRWHFAVVVGLDPAEDQVVLRSGTNPRRVTRTGLFVRTWRRGDYWAMVALEPGELPAEPDPGRYLPQVAALEQTGRYRMAVHAWQAALERWPDNRAARFGLGNSLYALGRHAEAEAVYRRLLDAAPGDVAVRNNRAMALGALGRVDEALAEIRAAMAANEDPRLAAELADTETTLLGLAAAGDDD